MFGVDGEELTARHLFASRAIPVILQAEAAECGLACLAMVSSHFGQRIGLAELRRRFSASLKGTTLHSLMEMADSLGMATRPVRLEVDELRQLARPAILHWNLRHFVVLERVKSKGVVIIDPAHGRREVSFELLSRHFTGIALELTPSSTFEKRTQVDRVRLADLFGQIRGMRTALIQLLALAAVTQIFALLSPLLNQLVVDGAISRGDLDLLSTIALGMIILVALNTVTALLRGYVSLYLGTQLSFQMQTNLLRHVLRLPAAWFEKRHVGDILSRFGSLTPAQNFVSSAGIAILLDSVMAVAAVSMMLIYAPRLGAIEIGALVVAFLLRLATFPYLRSKLEQGLHLGARVQSTFLETIRGARTFKAFGKERERLTFWQNEQAESINNTIEASRFGLWGGAGMTILGGAQQIIVWYFGARMVIQGHLSFGMLIAFQSYASQFASAASGLINQFFAYRTLKLHLERLADIVHADPEEGIDAPANHAKQFQGTLTLNNVSFRYADHEPWILRNVSLEIPAGRFVCFVGPSGQGKSTLVKLLMGFQTPQEGSVLIDGQPASQFGLRTYRSRIGVVMQDDQLFGGTIADNISFFDGDVDQEEIEEAAKAAQIHTEITQFPMGYLTLVGDMGSSLSGGQRQRVLLARALYRKPAVLFLDEGTANLDPGNESRVMEVIRSLPITRVVVAHGERARFGADLTYQVLGGSIRLESRALVPG
jgi:ATP-binding cassette subfamily B protein RaxB